ncbi:hypothetical protein GRI91_15430 [Altererythrobacter endophyticus]|uniref:Uncharacterized protein n=1 Tax=Altericroceibacterium endophyticum TaxID=1808508 RepID=A0A6I4T8A3_9SPHN|nr:hypothetical protein [Altericroceibacterium endophyticum]
MKFLFTALLLAAASPAAADGWYFEASLEGGAEFWTYTNATGEVSPRRVRGNEIWITRSDMVNSLGEGGSCSFDNCSVSVTLGGQVPTKGADVKISFSNGQAYDFAASGMSDVLFDNYTTAGMGMTNRFVQNIRAAQWVEVSFDGKSHKFSLAGSSQALDAIRPYLR